MNPIGPATAELALLLLLELGAAAAPAAGQTESAARSAGERFFLTGLAADGRAVPAVVQGDLRVTSIEMPCAGCHRRSGWAGNEGTINVAPVAGPALFAPVTRGSREMGALRTSGEGTRPAYTEATLMRAIREGIDPSGRTLAPTMPRYALREADATTLVAHLRSLSATPPPGVTDSEIHLATVLSPGVEAADRQAVHEVMRAFLKDKNAGTRHETRRRERGPWDMKQHYDAYRSWVLHEWELTGPPGGWPAQLETLYQRQPVFALVGGIVEGDASPLHDFAERMRLPTILPQTPLPPARTATDGFYTLYFSRAAALEADLLAERLAHGAQRRVLQIVRCGGPGEAAATRLNKRLASAVVTTLCYDGRIAPEVVGLNDVSAPGAAVVLWLAAADASRVLAELPPATGIVYLSSSLLGSHAVRPSERLGDRVLLLEPQVPLDELERHAWRSLVWLKAKGLSELPQRVSLNALYSMLLAAEALSHPTALVSREYFLERIEAMAARSPHRSAYPEVVFGPVRRFGSAGGYVMQVPPSPQGAHRKAAEWTVPQS